VVDQEHQVTPRDHPLATVIPALAALALVTAVWLALHTYELVWWREARA
jgi:hypothetical protein